MKTLLRRSTLLTAVAVAVSLCAGPAVAQRKPGKPTPTPEHKGSEKETAVRIVPAFKQSPISFDLTIGTATANVTARGSMSALTTAYDDKAGVLVRIVMGKVACKQTVRLSSSPTITCGKSTFAFAKYSGDQAYLSVQ